VIRLFARDFSGTRSRDYLDSMLQLQHVQVSSTRYSLDVPANEFTGRSPVLCRVHQAEEAGVNGEIFDGRTSPESEWRFQKPKERITEAIVNRVCGR
jgi:hypothetical protein